MARRLRGGEGPRAEDVEWRPTHAHTDADASTHAYGCRAHAHAHVAQAAAAQLQADDDDDAADSETLAALPAAVSLDEFVEQVGEAQIANSIVEAGTRRCALPRTWPSTPRHARGPRS